MQEDLVDRVYSLCEGLDIQSITDVYYDDYEISFVIKIKKFFYVCHVENDGQRCWNHNKFVNKNEAEDAAKQRNFN